MISKRYFVNKLKELGYVFKEQLHYQERFRLKETYERSTLKQAGQTKQQIEQFIREAKA